MKFCPHTVLVVVATLCLAACGEEPNSNRSGSTPPDAAPTEPPTRNQTPYRVEVQINTPSGPVNGVYAFENGMHRHFPIPSIIAMSKNLGGDFRIEGAESLATEIVLGKGRESYTLMQSPGGPIAVVDPAGSRDDSLEEYPYTNDLFSSWASSPRYAGSCSAAGEIGQRWEADIVETGETQTVCITSDGIELFEDSAEGRIVRVVRGDQPDDLFNIPQGYRVITAQEFEREFLGAQ